MTFSSFLRTCVSVAAFAGALSGAQAYAQTEGSSDWTGPYVGVQIGYQDGSADHSFSNGAPSDDSEPSGFVGGGHAGYNWRHENVVFGVEADIEGGDLNGDYVNTTGATSVGSTEVEWQASLRGRIGYASGANLFYATVGGVWMEEEFGGGPAPGPACCGYSDTVNGWTAGVGFERMLGSQQFLGGSASYRFEYRHTEMDDASGPLPPTFPAVTMPVEQTADAVRAALSVHF